MGVSKVTPNPLPPRKGTMLRHPVADRHLARAERAEGHKHDRTARKHLIAAGLTDWSDNDGRG